MYLGDKLRSPKLEKGVWASDLSPYQYVQERYRNVQKYAKKNLGGIWKFPSPKQVTNPFAMGYAPELDASNVLDPSLESYYQSQIGILRWMIELGRVDINTEVLILDSCLDHP